MASLAARLALLAVLLPVALLAWLHPRPAYDLAHRHLERIGQGIQRQAALYVHDCTAVSPCRADSGEISRAHPVTPEPERRSRE
jgi:hypothetical protein